MPRLLSILSYVIYALLTVTIFATDDQQLSFIDGHEPTFTHDLPILHTAFVQTGEELLYLSEPVKVDPSIFLSETATKEEIQKNKEARYSVHKLKGTGKLHLEFDPGQIDFGQNAVGKAVTRRVYVENKFSDIIVIDSIIGNTVDFHVSFFEEHKLRPQDTSYFDVVYLPRELGKRKIFLHIYTNIGIFSLKVTGECVSNPYRISPFVGFRLPYNGSVTKQIQIHNPYSHMLRIKEITSSGGGAHVELPHHVDENYAAELLQYWEIRPYQSKHIANVLLVGSQAENSTLFVRISGELIDGNTKLQDIDDILFPIPIEVSTRRGVFSTNEILDFGLMRHGERSQPQFFSVYQYKGNGRLEFETLYVEKGDHTGVYMEFASHPPIVVPASRGVSPGDAADLVKVYFDTARIDLPSTKPIIKNYSGQIIAVSRGGNFNITMPFRASVFKGELTPMGNDLSLNEELRPPHRRAVRLVNNLPFDIAIWNVSMSSDAQQYFSVRLVDKIVTIKPGDNAPAFVLKYNKKVPSSFDNAVFYVYTNVSTFRLVMNKFSGKMNIELTSVDKQNFDFGFVERNDTRTIRFVVWNDNKAEMTLKGLQVPARQAYRLYFVGMRKKSNVVFNDVSDDERQEYVQANDLDIAPESGAIFDLELKVPMDGTLYAGDILFETQYESKKAHVSYEVATGSLQSIPEQIHFGNSFPGKVLYRSLQVFNSFSEDMTVTRVATLSQDPRFFFESFDSKQPPLLRSGRLTNLGRVMFTPQIPCSHDYCYLGLPFDNSDGQWFVHGLTLPANLAEIDAYLYKKQRQKYDSLVKSGKHRVNTTVIIDTNKAKNIKIKTSAEMTWPRLLTRNSIQFPLTALGNFTIVNLTLSNPTNVPVAVQVIPLVIYPDAEALVELFRPHLLTPLSENVEMNETLMFSLRDTELFTLKNDSPVPRLREELESAIPNNIPRFTLSMMLKPHMKVRLRLGFLPSDYTLRSSLLLIRNNLTIMEPVVMYGKGARIGMKVEGVDARSKNPLLFEIRHDHLSDCNNPKRLMHKLHSTLTVRRPFTVHNSGDVKFSVNNMSINGVPCENRGFRILNCYPFTLLPNESYALDVAYTPDFLTTTNEADLQLFMHMNSSAWVFPLAATVPGDMLAKCHQALPRPPFENIMYYSCVTALIFCLVCVLACAYLEGDRAIACAIRQQFATPRTVFDLNNLTRTSTNAVAAAAANAASAGANRNSQNGGTWSNNAPSTLKVSDDAWFVSRVLVELANWIVQKVHSVWKWSLFYRAAKPGSTKPSKKKKKNPVSVINSKKEAESVKEEATVKLTTTGQTANTTPTNRKNNNQKAPSKSPRAATNKKNERKKSEDMTKGSEAQRSRDVSRQPAIREVEQNENAAKEVEVRTEQATRPVDKKINNNNKQQKTAKRKTEESPKQETTPVLATTRPASRISQATSPAVENVNESTAMRANEDVGWEEDARDWSKDLPATPTPSMMSNLDRMSVDWHMRQSGEEDQRSIASEESAMPDWADEVMTSDDVDADLSALAEATTNLMMSASEDEKDIATTPRQKKVAQHRSAASGHSPSTSTSEAPEPLDSRRRTIGSEKKEMQNMQQAAQHAAALRAAQAHLQLPLADPDTVPSYWNMLMPGLGLGNLLETPDDVNLAAAQSQLWNLPPVLEQPVPPPTSMSNPLTSPSLSMFHDIGFDLGAPLVPDQSSTSTNPPTFGNTLFSGRDFNLWSDTNFDPTTAWADLTKKNDDNDEEQKKQQ